jgi:DNA-binding NtrC family response regulator
MKQNIMKQAKEHTAVSTQTLYSDESMAGIGAREKHDAARPKAHILIIDDEVIAREQLQLFYTSKGYTVETADSGQEGLNLLNNSRIDLVIVYTGLAGLSGAEVIDQLQRNHPGVSVIVTGYWPIDHYRHELHYGAYDYMAKPFEHDTIHETTECALQKAYVFSESSSLRNTLNDTEGKFGQLLSKTPAMHETFEPSEWFHEPI